ncbi:MAG: tellurite resistance/C4-dicarboxylate transporter family protein [Thiothrix sp.]|uniref:tellurite resistance/C4-dicarboxylate transporter family protein n=1 Tax=Thiothrix sp. TaxID=1032 RepID=UPI00260BED0A|nr:tellurite resistance/C4-dicarboxylate transporter family protein [Thiothrix sp.]MDD5394005.1 tellurite resistance/C4-dicarboxylate transporter family protein [Thiothrix sp.]
MFPGYFALVMASGILSFAFNLVGQHFLSESLFGVTLLAWVVLLFLSAWRLLRFPKAVQIDLLNIRRVFAFFTLVVATDLVGILLNQHGYAQLAIACWAVAFVVWSLLLYLSFSVLTFLTHPHTVNVVHGDWLTSIIGTQSLVLLGTAIAPHLGEYADYMMVEVHLLWMLGLVLYGIFVTLFCYRIFFLSFKPEDTSPLLWVIMGAAAVGVNAGTGLLKADVHLPFLLSLHPFIDGVVMVMWAWATWWIPLLVIFGIWKHGIRRYPLRYEPALWSMVFPLGMYAVASFRLGLAADFPPLQWISQIMLWVAFATWCVVMAGLMHFLYRGFRQT